MRLDSGTHANIELRARGRIDASWRRICGNHDRARTRDKAVSAALNGTRKRRLDAAGDDPTAWMLGRLEWWPFPRAGQ